MKSLIVFAMLVAVAVGAAISTQGSEASAQVLRNDNDNIGVDGYNTSFETSNGIKQDASAVLKNVGTENEAIEVRGSFSYPGPDGVLYSIAYIANEFGFQPTGAHLPVAAQA